MCNQRLPKLFVVLFIYLVTACAFSQTDQTSKNKALVRGYLAGIANKRTLDSWDKYFAEQVVFNNSQLNEKGFKQILNSLLTTFPDFRITIEDQIAEGDKVFTRVTMLGTQSRKVHGYTGARQAGQILGRCYR
ncbi:ester cyclase [bacterium]|nr:ester cyclase [bacterium]